MSDREFYGVPSVYFIWHGEWNDPEIEYQGHIINYWLLEDTLWEMWKESQEQIDPFEKWIQNNHEIVYSVLEDIIYAV